MGPSSIEGSGQPSLGTQPEQRPRGRNGRAWKDPAGQTAWLWRRSWAERSPSSSGSCRLDSKAKLGKLGFAMWVLESSWWVLSRRKVRRLCGHSHVSGRFMLFLRFLFMSARIKRTNV